MDKFLEFKNVSFSYESNDIINDFSFDLYENEILMIKGKSGIGKSTILRIISGLENIENGEILVNGVNIENIEVENRNIGYLFQEFALFPHMNVFDNISYSISNMKKKEKNYKVKELLKMINLEGYEKKYPNELSGGEKQRVAFARSIAREPKLLLLDEPFSSLDDELREKLRLELREVIKKLKISAIIVSHDEKDEKIADRIIKI